MVLKKPPLAVVKTNADSPCAFAIAAPIKPPVREWEELTGIPNLAQKNQAQIIAPNNAERIRYSSMKAPLKFLYLPFQPL